MLWLHFDRCFKGLATVASALSSAADIFMINMLEKTPLCYDEAGGGVFTRVLLICKAVTFQKQ